MKKKVLETLYTSIQHELDGKTLIEAAEYLTRLAKEYYSEMDVIIEWGPNNYSDNYELALFESRDETEKEQEIREKREEDHRKQTIKNKKLQFEKLKRELGE